MQQKAPPPPWKEPVATARLVLQDGSAIKGFGLGATGTAVGEVCFNTAITGYEEILTDPSYASQIITFTFPHIGNVGVNEDDVETTNPGAARSAGVRGCVLRAAITNPSNYRSTGHFNDWLKKRGVIAISGVDTRALTALIRENGMPNAVIAHNPDGDFTQGEFELEALRRKAKDWPGLVGLDLAKEVSCASAYEWDQNLWRWPDGFDAGRSKKNGLHVVAIDYGVKRNILRCLASVGFRVTVVPAAASAKDILALNPDGIFLSNGPGDPAATGAYAAPVISTLVDSGLPIFGICLGHQMLALALGAKTEKMLQGHHGANHPVKDFTTGKVEITSMNHGFAVARDSLPDNVTETHVSLFDGSNCGLKVKNRPIFSVQYHPEASPGPQDSHYLFRRFLNAITSHKES